MADDGTIHAKKERKKRSTSHNLLHGDQKATIRKINSTCSISKNLRWLRYLHVASKKREEPEEEERKQAGGVAAQRRRGRGWTALSGGTAPLSRPVNERGAADFSINPRQQAPGLHKERCPRSASLDPSSYLLRMAAANPFSLTH